jgi:glyoxalase family protein
MRLEGIHHITAITADARRNVDFYARVLGLRLVKKTVNFDQPDAYHLYYGDERGDPGSIMTFFEFPGAVRGRHGAGMIHTLVWRVAGEEALAFWEERLGAEGVETSRDSGALRLPDPEGIGIELVAAGPVDEPLRAAAPDIPAEHALLGFDGVRAYASRPADSGSLLGRALGFEAGGGGWEVRGRSRASYRYDEPPTEAGIQGAGTVHHIAWAAEDADLDAWRRRMLEAGAHVTHVRDRQYFRSIYFREPSGVLFEIATLGPGFAIDEPLEELGESLKLPPQHEHLRDRLQQVLTPIDNPRAGAPQR